MQSIFRTPILFLIFNRSDTTTRVFSAIRSIKPEILFIAADGPRKDKSGEKEKCEETRKITENIDWPCEVKRLYRNKNLGCKLAVSGAIDWFFENVEEGIVLEDDCLPDPTFFKFCKYMLEKYRGDERIMHISGDNFQPKRNQLKSSYYFSKYAHVWGWATWRRAWKKYDVNITDWPITKSFIDESNDSLGEKLYWDTIFEAVYRDKIDTWDYQWIYAIWKNNGICVIPGINLVENIGFGNEATHTTLSTMETLSHGLCFPLVHPQNFKLCKNFDDYSSRHIYKHDPLTLLYLNLKYFTPLIK